MLTNLQKEMVGRLIKFEGVVDVHPKGTMLFIGINNDNNLDYYWLENNVTFTLSMKNTEIQEFLQENKTRIYGTVPRERGSVSYFMNIEGI